MATLTQKQESFCQSYIETGNASEAYRTAYNASGMKPATVNKRASEMLGKGAIAGRLAELRGEIAQEHGITIAALIIELEEARKVGKERGQAASMVAATMGKAKLVGLDKENGGGDSDSAELLRKIADKLPD
jgi:phage terminase small subunit